MKDFSFLNVIHHTPASYNPLYLVSSRQIHYILGVETKYKTWIKAVITDRNLMEDYEFVKGGVVQDELSGEYVWANLDDVDSVLKKDYMVASYVARYLIVEHAKSEADKVWAIACMSLSFDLAKEGKTPELGNISDKELKARWEHTKKLYTRDEPRDTFEIAPCTILDERTIRSSELYSVMRSTMEFPEWFGLFKVYAVVHIGDDNDQVIPISEAIRVVKQLNTKLSKAVIHALERFNSL